MGDLFFSLKPTLNHELVPPKFGNIILIALSLFCLLSCENEHNNDYLFSLIDSSHSGIEFNNLLPIDLELNIFNYMYYYNGGGVAIADLNNDGLSDIIFSSNLYEEKVYLNKGDLKFEDVSSISKIDGGIGSWTNGVSVADVNNDGMMDVYLAQVGSFRNLKGKNKLFICTGFDENNTPLYQDQAQAYGVDFQGFSTQAGFFDYDLDGDLDMYLMNHSLHHNGTFGKRADFLGTFSEMSGDRLYRNDGTSFTDVTISSGINSNVVGYGLGLTFGDVNNDGFPDIYVGNDFHENDYLYINQKDGTFKDELTNQIKHTSKFSMGVDIGDINNDNFLDIVSLDMLPEDPYILKTSEGEDALDMFNLKLRYGYNHQYAKNALQLNQGNGSFKEIGRYAGVHATDWSWSPLLLDFDMDGYKDLFVSNGIPKRMNDIDYINFYSSNDIRFKIQFDQLEEMDLSALEQIPEIKINNKFFKGTRELIFDDQKENIQNHKVSYSNSAAFADFDLDGDYDIITNNINDKAFLYENQSAPNSSVRIKLKGHEKNKFGLGSKILSYHKEKINVFNYSSTKGFQSSMINEILIPKLDLDSIKIIWPGLNEETKIYTGQEEILFDISSSKKEESGNSTKESIFEDITKQCRVDFLHEENSFVEFNREPLIPFSTSSDGPALCVGDVNGDGFQDFFVGSSKRKRNKLYIQNRGGTFETYELNGAIQDSIYEETEAVFVDIDNDKDLDLVVATGGNEYRLSSEFTKPLLYINIAGHLVRDEDAFANINLTASVVEADDMDGDGDIDLFFGGRAVPWDYGKIPTSFLLENDGQGNFKNVTTDWNSELSEIGFVKDAVWTDLDQDNDLDLVLALEWGPIVKMENNDNKFDKVNITDKKGWWNSVLVEDFNGDGRLDVFAGNLGENARFKVSKEEPVNMYFADFDDNGKAEQILTYFLDGREIPFSNKMEIQKQIPSLKKNFLHAKDFAKASISELFGLEKIKEIKKYSADHFSNTLFLNTASNSFSEAELPKEIQYSSYNCSFAVDLNADGKMDIVPGGNYAYCNVQMGIYDAENGSYLLNEDDGFSYYNMFDSPLKDEVRNISSIEINGKNCLIFAQNNGPLKILEIKN